MGCSVRGACWFGAMVRGGGRERGRWGKSGCRGEIVGYRDSKVGGEGQVGRISEGPMCWGAGSSSILGFGALQLYSSGTRCLPGSQRRQTQLYLFLPGSLNRIVFSIIAVKP